jgi:phosphate transport system substrate-binding protein
MTLNNKFKWFASIGVCLMVMILIITGCAGNSTTTAKPTTVTATATTTVPANPTTVTATTTTTATATVTTTAVPDATSLNGAGATFPQPLYTKWFDVYYQAKGVKINYQGVGSGAGIQQITAGTVDFGASDGIMTADQIAAAAAKGGPILHIPMTSGSEAIIYNITGITSGQLKLSGDVLANIFLKVITKWNDPAITALNPGLTLPNAPIAVVHRSDGSGTTYIFTNYLSKVSTDWSTKVGNATSVNWPGDIGGQGNAGVAGQVQQLPNSIGYVELAYALQNNLPYASLKNAAGNYELPTLAGTTAASVGVTLPADMKIMITNATNPDAYPICGYTWILAFVNQPDQAKGQTLAKMLWWAIHDGQQYSAALNYAALSPAAVTNAENEILSMQYQGKALITR